MGLNEYDVMAPLFLVLVVLCFMVFVPWIQACRYKRWRTEQDEPRHALSYFFQPNFGGRFAVMDVCGIFLLLMLFGFPLIASGQAAEAKQVVTVELLQANAAFQALLLVIIMLRVSFSSGGISETLGLREGGALRIFAQALLVCLLSFGAAVFLGVVGWQTWVESTFGAENQELVEMMAKASDPEFKFWLIFSAVLVAPICEEILFRGYLFGVLRDLVGSIPAMIFSGLFFGLIHANLQALPILCFLGIGLAVIYHATRSIWAPILCHFVFNLCTTLQLIVSPPL